MTAVKAVAAAVCGWLLTVVGLGVLDVPLGWSVMIGLPVAALALVTVLSPRAGTPVWQPLPVPPSGATESQASALANRLAEARQDPGRFHSRVRPRLGRLALARLRQRQETADLVSLADPRAVSALGEPLHRLITDPTATLPTPGRTAELLSRLENL